MWRSQLTFPQNPSPVTRLHADVLREVFEHCLPENPFDWDEVQPNTTIAPMLLCHVCSFWREVALSAPSLWTHFHYFLQVRWTKAGEAVVWDLERDLECLRWWRKNRRSMAPSIRLTYYAGRNEDGIPLTDDIRQFFVDYLSQAQYLDVEEFIDLLFQRDEGSRPRCISSSLRSLVTNRPSSPGPYLDSGDEMEQSEADEHASEDESDDSLVDSRGENNLEENISVDGESVSNHSDEISKEGDGEPSEDEDDENEFVTVEAPWARVFKPFVFPPTLTRLALYEVEIVSEHMDPTFLSQWSSITHLSLHCAAMLPEVLHSLLSALPNLQWGYVNIFLKLPDGGSSFIPPKLTLPFLSTLSFYLDHQMDDPVTIEGNPLRQLFTSLCLPSLRDLTIYIQALPWLSCYTASRLNDVFACAPAVTKFTLGLQVLTILPSEDDTIEPDDMQVQKLSMYAPHLAHVVFDMWYAPKESTYKKTLSDRLADLKIFLTSTGWLDLASPANNIRKITAEVTSPSEEGALVEACIREMLKISEGIDQLEAEGIEFEIVAQDMMSLSLRSYGWKMLGH